MLNILLKVLTGSFVRMLDSNQKRESRDKYKTLPEGKEFKW